MKTATPTIVVFDLGGVLIAWNPDHLFRKLIANETERKWFLANVCNSECNLQQDGGRPFSEAISTLSTKHPEHAHLIAAFHARWTEMIVGTMTEGIAIFEALESTGVPLFALTNWSAETSPDAESRQLVFIDDDRRNVDAARELGWHVIHHTTPADTAAQLRSWSLLP